MVWGMENWGRGKFYFYGTPNIPDRESALVISNHVSLLDWMYIFSIAGRKGRLGVMKFFAKVRNHADG